MSVSEPRMLDGAKAEDVERAPPEVWIDWSYWQNATTNFEDLFATGEEDVVREMTRKPVRYVRADTKEG